MIVGNPESGKHTFVSKLLDSYECNLRVFTGKWKCRPSSITKKAIRFRIWVFKSLEDYASTHDCFLSQHSLYLLLFDAKHESKGVHDTINTWLERIACRAPHCSIIFIGTHMDEISHQDYGEILLQQAKVASEVYKLEVAGVLQIDLKRSLHKVLDKIHSYGVNFPPEAIQSNQIRVMNELLMKANEYPDKGHVHWRGLQLCDVDTPLLREIYWVKQLNLSRNNLTTLPEESGDYLKQVYINFTKLDITSPPVCT
jgi:GTPase SAR1 family protein